MKADLNRLVEKPKPEIKLGAPATPEAMRAKTGLEREQTGKGGESEEVTAQSTDGLFTFVVRVVKT
jgi:hypothetical protein